LDAIVEYLPNPLDIPPVKGLSPKTNEVVERKADKEEPLSALIFKISADKYTGKLAYVRVYSGILKEKENVYNVNNGKRIRLSNLYQMHANKQIPKTEVSAGDICAIAGIKEVRTGDTLCSENKQIVLETIKFPEPVIGIVVEPKSQKDIDRLSESLQILSEEDPTFKVDIDKTTGQRIISGMGELHLEVLIDRLDREFSVKCNQGKPQVSYKEALTQKVEHHEIFDKETGGKGKFAEIKVRISSLGNNSERKFEFVNSVDETRIPKHFIPAIEKGFKEGMNNGPLAGYPIDSLKVELVGGSYIDGESDDIAFEIAAKQALRNASEKTAPVLLEPFMKVEIVTPGEYLGDIVSDLNKRRARIKKTGERANIQVIDAIAPLSEMFGYVTKLRTLSSGRASSTMEFSHYDQVDTKIAEAILDRLTGKIFI
jgi:elongation factor G